MSDHYEPLSPVDIERKLRGLVTAITGGQEDLAKKRDAEVNAEVEYRKSRLRGAHDAPKPKRGSVLAAERDEYIDEASLDEWAAWRHAVSERETAQDYLRALIAQAQTVQSMNASVRQAYGMAGA